MVLGKRAEKKSLAIITVIFILGVIGATMSSTDYRFGQEAVTGGAILEGVDAGLIGLILAGLALAGIVLVGISGMIPRNDLPPSYVVKKADAVSMLPALAATQPKTPVDIRRLDNDIAELTRQIKSLK